MFRRKKRLVLLVCIIPLLAGMTGAFSPTPYAFPELKFFPAMPASASNPVTREGAELGRFLFYDPILSADSTFSCASCHKQQYAFSDAPNAFSKGIGGQSMKRNTLPLFNLAWYPAYFWDGRATSLENQVFQPVSAHDEMNMSWTKAVERINRSNFYREKFQLVFGEAVVIDSVKIANVIAQFERTLLSFNSKYDKVFERKAAFTKDEYEGFVLVNDQTKGDCLHCHTTDANALGTTLTFSNNGLDAGDYKDKGRGNVTGNPKELGQFKIPSLRNVAVTGPYMHDGRFTTLEQVVAFYSSGVNAGGTTDSKMEFAHQGGNHLTPDEQRKIVLFLETLTDSTFITNPAFGNPFK